MSQKELEKLLREEKELQEKMEKLRVVRREIQTKRLEVEEKERVREMQSQEITVSVVRLSGGNLLTHSEYRDDVVGIWRDTEGRSYRGKSTEGKGQNLIPINQWDRAEERLLSLPNVSVEWEDGVREELEWYLNAPPWTVDVHDNERFFLCKAGPRESGYRVLARIPGASYDYASKTYKIPVSEGWRIFETFEGFRDDYGREHPEVEGVVYTEKAQEIILGQVEDRSKLDLVAKKEDSDFIRDLEGNVLRPFQRVGVEFIAATDGRCLLADGTGLGKTWQSLGFSEHKRAKDNGDRPFQTIVVVKAANIPNWEREIERLTGEKALVLKSGRPDYLDIQAIIERRIPYAIISYDTLGILRTKVTEVLGDDGEELVCLNCDGKGIDWTGSECGACDGRGRKLRKEDFHPWVQIFLAAKPDLLILDEAHQIKNPDANRSRATRALSGVPHVIPMTASPVLNRTEELWPILYMLNPHTFKVHQHFLNTYTYGGKRPRNVGELHELLKPMFLRRKKSDVLEDLPPINRITELHGLSSEAKGSYNMILSGIYESLGEFDPRGVGGEKMNVMSILAQITRLKQVCAVDKVEHTVDLAMELADEHGEGQNGEDGKILVYSQFKGTAYAIARSLGSQAICTVKRTERDFVSLDAKKRDSLFEEAREDPRVKYVVTTEAAKEGHNLEFCNWVIFNDPFWTPAGHNQCEGRAYGRLSNPHPIDSFYIIADCDIERWINDLLQTKLSIIQETVENIESTRDEDLSVGMELIKKMKEAMWSQGAKS